MDGISSLWCNVHGHRVPEIDNAIREQLDRIAHSTLLGLSNVPSIELARELVRRTPGGLTKVFYSDSGATAVESALKIAYQYHRQKPHPEPERDLFVCLGDAYHGDTVGSVSVGGMELFHGVYRNLLFKTLRVPAPVPFLTPPELTPETYLAWCFDEVEAVLKEHHPRIAGFIIEPLVQGAAGIWVHARGYLKHVRETTRQYGIPLIADEVAVGFGRTGTMFACEQEQVEPDLMCVAKGLTGGYLPVAATLATEEIYNAFLGEPAEGKTFYHGHTYTGNPLGLRGGFGFAQTVRRQPRPGKHRPKREASGRKAGRPERSSPCAGSPAEGDHGRHPSGGRPRRPPGVPGGETHRPSSHARRPQAGRHLPSAGRCRRAHARPRHARSAGGNAVRSRPWKPSPRRHCHLSSSTIG